MYALDEARNARDWNTFDAYHDQSDIVVYWPGYTAFVTDALTPIREDRSW
jgi:hypothetical protein